MKTSHTQKYPALAKAWLLAGFTAIWIALTVLFAWAVYASPESQVAQKFIPSSSSDTLAVLRFLSEGVAIFLTALVAIALELFMWGLAGRPGGVSVSTLLGMSHTTGLSGLLRLLRWAPVRSRGVHDRHHLLAIIRFVIHSHSCLYLSLLCFILVPLMGIIILSLERLFQTLI